MTDQKRQATEQEIANGSAPYVYDIHPDDSPACKYAKVASNNEASNIMSMEDEGVSSEFTPIVQHAKYHIAERNVKNHCKPKIRLASYEPSKYKQNEEKQNSKQRSENERIDLENVLNNIPKFTKENIKENIRNMRDFVHDVCHPKDIEIFDKGYNFVESVFNCVEKCSIGSFIKVAGSIFGLFKNNNSKNDKMMRYIFSVLSEIKEEIKKGFNEIKNELNTIQKMNIETLIKVIHIENVQTIDHDLIVNIYNSIMHGSITDQLYTIMTNISKIQYGIDKIRYTQIVENCLSQLAKCNVTSSENYTMTHFNNSMEEIDVALLKCSSSEGITYEMRSDVLFEYLTDKTIKYSNLPIPSFLEYITLSVFLHISLISPVIDEDSKISWSNMNTLQTIKKYWESLISFSDVLQNDEIARNKISNNFTDSIITTDKIRKRMTKEINTSMLIVKCEQTKKIIAGIYNIQDTEFLKLEQMPKYDLKNYYDKYDWFHSTRRNDCHGRRDKAKFDDDFGFIKEDGGFIDVMSKHIREEKEKLTQNWNCIIDKIISLNADEKINGFYIPLIYPMNGDGIILPMPIDIMIHQDLRIIGYYQLFVNPNLMATYTKTNNIISIIISDKSTLEMLSNFEIKLDNFDIDDDLMLWWCWNGGLMSHGSYSKITTHVNHTGQGNTWYKWLHYPILSLQNHRRNIPTNIFISEFVESKIKLEQTKFNKSVNCEYGKNIIVVNAEKEYQNIESTFKICAFFRNNKEWKKNLDNLNKFIDLYSSRVSEKPKNTLMEIRNVAYNLYKMIRNPDISKEEMMHLADMAMASKMLTDK